MKQNSDASFQGQSPQSIVGEAIQFIGQTVWYSNLHKQRFVKTLEFIIKHIGLAKNTKVLEIGSWPNYFTVALHRAGAQIIATDLKPERIEILKRLNIPIVKLDLHQSQTLPFKKNYYDCIVFCEVIEHLNPKKISEILLKLKEVLAPGGIIILTAPNKFCLGNLLRFQVKSSKGENNFGYGHWKEYSQKEIELYFINCGMKISESKLINFYLLAGKTKHRDYFYPIFSFLKHNNKLRNFLKIMLLPVRILIPIFRDSIVIVARK